MTRREIREHVFRMLFRKDFHQATELEEQMKLYISEWEETEEEEKEIDLNFWKEPSQEEYGYIKNRCQAIIDQLVKIDSIISEVAVGWKINRMGKVDLTILRLAVYEIHLDEDIPVKVAINEAVELAKKFGGEESPSFVNGILAKVAKKENEE